MIQFFFLSFPYANFNSSCTADVKRPSPLYSEKTNQRLCVLVPGYLFFPPYLFLGTTNLIFPANRKVRKCKKSSENENDQEQMSQLLEEIVMVMDKREKMEDKWGF